METEKVDWSQGRVHEGGSLDTRASMAIGWTAKWFVGFQTARVSRAHETSRAVLRVHVDGSVFTRLSEMLSPDD